MSWGVKTYRLQVPNQGAAGYFISMTFWPIFFIYGWNNPLRVPRDKKGWGNSDLEFPRMSFNSNIGPNWPFFVSHQVSRMIVELCHKALANSLVRKTHEAETNQRLLDKHVRQIWNVKASCKRDDWFPSLYAIDRFRLKGFGFIEFARIKYVACSNGDMLQKKKQF